MRKWVMQWGFEAIVVTALATVTVLAFGALYGATLNLQVVA